MEEPAQLLREALMESYPYLAKPSLVQALIEDLASRYRNVEEVLKELEVIIEERRVDDQLLLTDVRILANHLKRLLTPRSRY